LSAFRTNARRGGIPAKVWVTIAFGPVGGILRWVDGDVKHLVADSSELSAKSIFEGERACYLSANIVALPTHKEWVVPKRATRWN